MTEEVWDKIANMLERLTLFKFSVGNRLIYGSRDATSLIAFQFSVFMLGKYISNTYEFVSIAI